MSLKLFQNFTRLHIKVEVTPKDRPRFLKQYGALTGLDASENIRVVYRKPGPTAWGVAYRIFFKADKWVIESLKMLGHHIEPLKNDLYLCSREDLFWDLMEFGYRIGENENIPYELYQVRQHLKSLKTQDLQPFEIYQIESENPTVEAEMLAIA
jgi:hypothetical protein